VLLAELAAKDRQLRAETGSRATAAAELATVTAERQRLVDKIAYRDRQFAAEIVAYRREVASIANSPDLSKRAALQRYVDGNRAGGFAALIEIQRAETKAVAAGSRELGALALDRKDRGEMTTGEVIPIFAEAQRLDPEDAWGWMALRRLYQEAGRLSGAEKAAREALRHSTEDRDRGVAWHELGAVLFEKGKLAEARDAF
jgi:tetratricopeptide (TPR) repeat protein